MLGRISLILCFCLAGCNLQWALREDNDAFTKNNSDQYYTQGLELAVRQTEEYEYYAGQKIYTPDDKFSKELEPLDRPYAGYLYGGARHTLGTGPSTDDTYSIELGVVGPSAGGEFAQNNVHDLLGNRRAEGWRNQLKDEPVVNAGYSQSIHGTTGDGFPLPLQTAVYWGWDVGNFLTASKIGGRLERTYDAEPFNIRTYSALEGQLKLRDITLDGNTWKNSHSVEKDRLVAAWVSGVQVEYDTWYIQYLYRYLTREFKEQKDQYNYGSINIGKNF